MTSSFAPLQGVSDLSINPSLLVASLDLNLVKLIRQAIRTADLTTAASNGRSSSESVAPVIAARPNSNSGIRPAFFVRNCDKPAATFEPRTHATHACENVQPCMIIDRTVQEPASNPSIQAPWKVLAWPTSPKPIRAVARITVKIRPDSTDVVDDVGRTLDLFV